jgi:outer membrane receptor for ferric coprogen and ferric-rhodotorulic acid
LIRAFAGSFDITGLRNLPVNIYRWDDNARPVFGPAFVTFDSTRRQKASTARPLRTGRRIEADRRRKVMSFDSNYVTDTTERYHSDYPVSQRRKFTPYGGLVYDLSPAHTLHASFATIYEPQNAIDRNGA